MICKNCNRTVKESSIYCNYCGTKQKPSRIDIFESNMNSTGVNFNSGFLNLGSFVETPSWKYYVQEAIKLIRENEPFEAIEYYSKAISLNPDDTQLYHDRGKTYYEIGKLKESVKDYDKSLSLDKNNFNARINRGISRCQLGLFEESIEDFSYVLSIQPDSSTCYTNRAIAYFELEKLALAKADILKALEFESKDPINLYLAGEIYYRLGEKYVAVSFFEKSAERGFSRAANRLNKIKGL